MTLRAILSIFIAVLGLSSADIQAGPYVPAGDLALRHDIQRLADAGVIKGPVTTWPLAWGPILVDLENANIVSQSAGVRASLTRVRERASWETRSEELVFNAKAAVAADATRIRGFRNTPRGDVEVSVGAGWTDKWFSAELNIQGVDSDQDDDEVRADNSLIGLVVGNWAIAASTQERWWGPGWDGSVILSNNARPMPALIVDRIFTEPFETRWLSWIGPWDFSFIVGQMEKQRFVPDTRFLGFRVNFRPLPSLEIGLSRTAQWCGDSRPCDFDTFVDLAIGNDNIGDAGIGIDNEPGNQLAGVDFRWSPRLLGYSTAFYGQFIGEDEAGGFPSRWLGQFGGEWAGTVSERWSARVFAEFAGTSCQFYESSERFNCAYNHGIYQTGYRYRGRSVGHAADNDARIVSIGTVLVDDADTQWHALLRHGALNRGGTADIRNSLTATRQDISSVDVSHSRVFSFGVIDAGAGYERVDDIASGNSFSDSRFYLQWRSSY